MAKKTPTGSARVEARVKLRRLGPALGLTLPINPGYRDPNEVDRARGVDPVAPEAAQGERAIAARSLAELVPTNLRMWIFRQARRRGGTVGLVEQLLAMEPIPAGRDREHYRKALLRSIERSGPAKKPGRKQQHGGIAKVDYRRRIALLHLHDLQVVLAVYGKWALVSEGRRDAHYSWFYTDPSDHEELLEAREIIARGGDMFVAAVESLNNEKVVGSAVLQLEWLHALMVQIR